MTSGEFRRVEINSIIIGERHRVRLDGPGEGEKIDDKVKSIARSGLIHPIVITRETHELVSGYLRVTACKRLGWTHISAQYQDECSPLQLKLIELEENVKRLDLTWQEQATLVHELDKLSRAKDPTWTQQQTAELVGLKESTVSELLQNAKEVLRGN